jgi:hypothetical protein
MEAAVTNIQTLSTDTFPTASSISKEHDASTSLQAEFRDEKGIQCLGA